MKTLATALLLTIAATPVLAGESAGLMLPPGFHATIVADGLGAGARHVAVRGNGDIYVSTRRPKENAPLLGVWAIQVDKNHKAIQTDRFGAAEGGTGMRLYKGALYVAGPDRAAIWSATACIAAISASLSTPRAAFMWWWRERAISAPIPMCPRTRSLWASNPVRC